LDKNRTAFTRDLRRSLFMIAGLLAISIFMLVDALHPSQFRPGHSLILQELQRAGPTWIMVFYGVGSILMLFCAVYFTVAAIRRKEVFVFDRNGVRFGWHRFGWDEIAVVRPSWIRNTSGVAITTTQGRTYRLLAIGLSGTAKDIVAAADYWRGVHEGRQDAPPLQPAAAGSSTAPALDPASAAGPVKMPNCQG
jgi:hypothetical protein